MACLVQSVCAKCIALSPRPMDGSNADQNEGYDTPEEPEREERRRRMWLKDFGVPPPPWEDEARAPPLDGKAVEDLRAFARDELPKPEFRRIADLIMRFRSWCDKFAEIHHEERLKERNQRSS